MEAEALPIRVNMSEECLALGVINQALYAIMDIEPPGCRMTSFTPVYPKYAMQQIVEMP